MRSPLAYYGGKAGMASRIVELMPEHRVYMEPFFGSGAVLFAKQPARFEIVNDLDHALVTFFRVLRSRLDELEQICALTPHAREEFDRANLDEDRVEELELARRFWVRVNQSFAKTAGRQTGWSITTARTQSVPASILSRLGRFAEVANRLAGVTIECCDGADLITRLATEDTVIYVDPPYLASTRVARQDRGVANDYRQDMSTPDDHVRLGEALRAAPAAVVLSGYPSELYDEMYADWWSVDFTVTAHSSNAATSGRSSRVERIWCNREPDLGRLDFGEAAS